MSTETTEQVAAEILEPAVPPVPKSFEPLLQIANGMAVLRAESQALDQVDVAKPDGDKLQRQLRRKCVILRNDLDRAYESVNAPLLAAQRQARELVANLKRDIKAIEDPHDAAIREREAAAAAKAEALRVANEQRVNRLRARMDAMRGLPMRNAGKQPADVEAAIKVLTGITIGSDFDEFKTEAEMVHAEALASLRDLLDHSRTQAEEAARLAAERAELDRQRHLDAKLREIEHLTVGMASRGAAAIEAAMQALDGVDVGDSWGDYQSRAESAVQRVRADLQAMLADAQHRERVSAEQAAEAQRLVAQTDVLRAAAEKRMAAAYEAARKRVGDDRPYDVYLSFVLDHGDKVPLEKVDDYIASLEALQPEQPVGENAAAQDSQRHESGAQPGGDSGNMARNTADAASGGGLAEGGAATPVAVSPGTCEGEAGSASASTPPVGGGLSGALSNTANLSAADVNSRFGAGLMMTRAYIETVLGVPATGETPRKTPLWSEADVKAIAVALGAVADRVAS